MIIGPPSLDTKAKVLQDSTGIAAQYVNEEGRLLLFPTVSGQEMWFMLEADDRTITAQVIKSEFTGTNIAVDTLLADWVFVRLP